MVLHELALCSGVLAPLASELAGWTTVAAVENDAFCREVLLRRQLDGVLPVFPIWDDLRTFDGRPWRGAVDLVTAGFPCQPFSSAGKREGEADDRNLWPDVLRVVREVEPEWVFLENVAGLLAARGADGLPYLGTILGQLAESGFDCRWDCIPASALGAPHQRDRLWVVAHANRLQQGRRHEPQRRQDRGVSEFTGNGTPQSLADAEAVAERAGLCQGEPTEQRRGRSGDGGGTGRWWATEPTDRKAAVGSKASNYSERCGQVVADTNRRRLKEHPQLDGNPTEDSPNGCAPGQHPCRRGDEVANPPELQSRQAVKQCSGIDSIGHQGEGTLSDPRCRGGEGPRPVERGRSLPTWWLTEPDVGRVADGVPFRVDRLRALGGGWVPIVAATAWEILK